MGDWIFTSLEFVAGITILFFIIFYLVIMKLQEGAPKRLDSTSEQGDEEPVAAGEIGWPEDGEGADAAASTATIPIVNIKRAWKGVEIVILNIKGRDQEIYKTYLGFVFIPFFVVIFILLLNPLEKINEEKTLFIYFRWGIILFGVIWICSLYYKLYGDTHIIVKDSAFIVKNQIGDFGIPFKYKFHNISNLYMSNPDGAPFGYNIGIDYKGETITLIDFLTETEAKSIITELQKHIDISPIRAS